MECRAINCTEIVLESCTREFIALDAYTLSQLTGVEQVYFESLFEKAGGMHITGIVMKDHVQIYLPDLDDTATVEHFGWAKDYLEGAEQAKKDYARMLEKQEKQLKQSMGGI